MDDLQIIVGTASEQSAWVSPLAREIVAARLLMEGDEEGGRDRLNETYSRVVAEAQEQHEHGVLMLLVAVQELLTLGLLMVEEETGVPFEDLGLMLLKMDALMGTVPSDLDDA